MKIIGDKAKCCFCGKIGKVVKPGKEIIFKDNMVGYFYPGYDKEYYICNECSEEKEIFKESILNLVDCIIK